MPRYIIKVADKYMEYSTIVDAVVTMPMTLDEFKAYYKDRYGTEGMRELPERLERVEAKGTSCMMDEDVRDTLRGNHMLDVPIPCDDGDLWEMSFEEFEQHVKNLTGPFADD